LPQSFAIICKARFPCLSDLTPTSSMYILRMSAVAAAVEAAAERVAGEDFFIANSQDMMTTREFFQLIAKHTGVPAPKGTLNLTAAYWFASVTSWLATHIIRSEPTAPVDVIRTAQYGSIEYTCQKSVDVLGLTYAKIDEAVAESVEDVKKRLKEHSQSKSGTGRALLLTIAALAIFGSALKRLRS